MTNRLDSPLMSASNDDFWGSQSDWSDRADTQQTTRVLRADASIHQSTVPLDLGAERPGQRIKRRWSKLLSSGANPTREHGIVRPEPARSAPARPVEPSADMFDDLDDFDYTYGDAAMTPTTPRTDPVADADPQGWDAEFAPAPVVTGRTKSPGVDPLLTRLGVVAFVAALLVPVLSSFRGSSTESLIKSSSSSELTATFYPLRVDAVAADGPIAEVPTGQLDPNDLPPAVPVNTQTGAVAGAAALNTEPVAAARSADPVTTPTNGSAALDAAGAHAPAERVERICAIGYEVVAGDFWIRVADAAEVPLAELLEVNGATSLTPIYPGTSICLPAGATTPVPPTATAPPTTTPPTTVPTTTTPSSTHSTPGEVKQIIRDVWPDELEERAIAIAYRESRFVPTAKNACCYGLFQIYWKVHRSWLDDIGVTDGQQLYDPATNARAAYELYQRAGGWAPWGF